MSWRFRRSVTLFPGFKLNFGKKSTGVTIGNKFGRVSFNSSGKTTVGSSIPGTGVSYSRSFSNRSGQKVNRPANVWTETQRSLLKKLAICIIVGMVLLIGGCVALSGETPNEPNTQIPDRSINIDPVETVEVIDNSAVIQRYSALVENADISVYNNDEKDEITVESDYSANDMPQDWDELSDAFAKESNAGERTNVVTLKAEDGTILLSAANGKVIYDYYKKQAENSQSSEETSKDDYAYANRTKSSYNNLVYVSKNNIIHRYSSCSNMKDYTAMTESEARSKGCTYCKRCYG